MASHTVDWREAPPPECRGGAAAVGNFDGVHRGHAALLSALRVQALAHSGPAVALTFDPHPLALLRPGQVVPHLTTLGDRSRLLHDLGADQVLVLRATPELLALSAEEFFARVLRGGLGVRALVEGPNFGFGRGRGGTVETLGRLCRDSGVALTVVPPVRDGESGEVSSSRVRAALLGGEVAAAAELLGRPYRLHGTVVEGRRRGNTLGFPTANLDGLRTLAPGDGVYAARVEAGGTTWPAAVNVGPNPTFGEGERKVEAHLIGFTGDLYGRPLVVDFLARLRDTRPFADPESLVRQLRADVDAARRAAGPASV